MSQPQDKYYYGLNEQLRQLALVDWVTFCELIGDEAMSKAKICILLSRENTLGETAIKLNLTKRTVQIAHENKCTCQLKAKIKPSVT